MVSFIKFHPMKKILLLLSILLFIQCGSIENYTTPDNKPALFNLNDIPAITLEFELKDWNKLLTNYDLNLYQTSPPYETPITKQTTQQ